VIVLLEKLVLSSCPPTKMLQNFILKLKKRIDIETTMWTSGFLEEH
jgi:hypothetical protein